MALTRRQLMTWAGAGLATASLPIGCDEDADRSPSRPRPAALAAAGEDDRWESVRAQFRLTPERIHLACMLLASHPAPVRQAIERHRDGLDLDPVGYVRAHRRPLEAATRQAAANYLGAAPEEIALTDSTTMGLALVYHGLRVRAGQELLTTEHDHYSTHKSLEYAAARSGARERRIRLYADPREATEDEIVQRVAAALRPETRVLAVTWVSSNTGLKIPVRRIASAVEHANRGRGADDRILLCVDGVHGLGVEDAGVADLGCDFLIAGTHKWLFGPRGTGIVWGHPRAHDTLTPVIPSFSPRVGWGGRMTPGGFHSFEHRWALAQAFEFHDALGRASIAERTHALARRFKEGIVGLRHVRLHTPMDVALSSGIVAFDVDGMRPAQVVERLGRRNIIASVSPYDPPHARITPTLINSPEEVDRAIEAVRDLG